MNGQTFPQSPCKRGNNHLHTTKQRNTKVQLIKVTECMSRQSNLMGVVRLHNYAANRYHSPITYQNSQSLSSESKI